jgi:hypothetical protein
MFFPQTQEVSLSVLSAAALTQTAAALSKVFTV